MSIDKTIHFNTIELHKSARILGIAEIVELGFPTDSLADVPETKLRERFIYLIRKYRPYTVFTFDPFGLYEGNMDHIATAQAVEEAFWVACFDKHHPEHFEEGLKPFSVAERWYFARDLRDANHYEDVTDYMDKRIAAFATHKTMVANILNQFRLQLKTMGRRMPMLEEAMKGDSAPLLGMVLTAQAQKLAQKNGLAEGRLAEAFRVDRFGGLDEFFLNLSEPL
jgi:LmbE family N-acetylglucosaminyl deacetylase